MKSNASVVVEIKFFNKKEIEYLYYDESAPSLDCLEKGELFQISQLNEQNNKQKNSIKQCISEWFCCRRYKKINY